MIDERRGYLPLVTFDAEDGWDELHTLAQPELNKRGMWRLKSALNGVVRTVAVERHYIDKDYRDTFSAFHSKRFSTPQSRCLRLHFFSQAVARDEIRRADKKVQDSYLGYAVIRPTLPNCLGRTLLTPDGRTSLSGSLCLCNETVSIQGTELVVRGFPFISQDTDATVCAESALWMLIRYFSNRYRIYPETYPCQLARLIEGNPTGRVHPSSGLYVWQMAEALRQIGFSPVTYSRANYATEFDHYVYTYIESGIPVLAATEHHVVVALGHRSDYTSPASPTTAISYSSQFNHAFVINDDNRFPYQLLRDSAPQAKDTESTITFSDLTEFIAPLPEKVFLPAESFQKVVRVILDRGDIGFKALSPRLSSAPLVLRLFLTSGRSFKKRLSERGMGHPTVAEVYRNLPFPHFLWVCEIAHMADYLRHTVQGEILWDATRNVCEPDGWIAVHYPETLKVDLGSPQNLPQKLHRFDLQSSQVYPLYRSNLHDIHL